MAEYIDRQAAIAYAISGRVRTLPTSEDGENWIRTAEVRQSLLAIPSADVEPVVRCKDCIDWNSETLGCKRNPSVAPWWEDDFCNYGERTDGEQNG